MLNIVHRLLVEDSFGVLLAQLVNLDVSHRGVVTLHLRVCHALARQHVVLICHLLKLF